MSIGPNAALRTWRIIALPLTRPKIHTHSDASPARILTYYHFQITAPKTSSPKTPAGNGTWSKLVPEDGFAKWITTKASDVWANFGKADGGWKLKVYQTGERIVDRLEFEELALKGIDPSLRNTASRPGISDTKQAEIKIPLIYPPSINSGLIALGELRASVTHRIPRHRNGFYFWMILAPFTAPFMIIPVIPNLPFFFCAWRSWSHYKAYRASQYLQTLLDDGAITPEANETLDIVYKDFPAATKKPTETTPVDDEKLDASEARSTHNSTSQQKQQHEVLLSRDAVPVILSLFGLKPSSGADILRAVEQARLRVLSGRSVL